MKKLILFITFILISAPSFAQEKKEFDNSLKANPLGFLIRIGKINYEKKISESSSAQLGAFLINYSASGDSFSGFGLIPEYRFYINDNAIDGFYLAPFLKYNNLTVKSGGFKGALNIYRIGAKAGMQWLFGRNDNFVVDLAFGAKYSVFNLAVKFGSEDSFNNENLFTGISPELNLAIGFAF